MLIQGIAEKLREKKLKVTPQRIAVLETIFLLNNHPTAESIVEYISDRQPNISVATVYKVLDVFAGKGLIARVKTENGIMRYDAITEHHHHLYCSGSDRIEDYFDNELNKLLRDYFSQKKIPGFEIEDIKLQINGQYK